MRRVGSRLRHARTLARVARTATASLRPVLDERVGTLLEALGPPPAGADGPEGVGGGPLDRLAYRLRHADESELWLTLAVLEGVLPLEEQVVAARRRLELDGPLALLDPIVRGVTGVLSPDRLAPARVRVLVGGTTVDVHHTAQTHLATGIQRVARETARRWAERDGVELVGWTPEFTAMRPLDDDERRTALHAVPPVRRDGWGPQATWDVTVPWTGHHVTLELATDAPRTARMLAMARFSRCTTGVIGFDCVPLTSADTIGEGMGGAFARQLAAVREMDRVAAISEAAATEYRGWRTMLGGLGVSGPSVEAVPLPVQAQLPSPEAVERVRRELLVGGLPMVLVVGSHEPRKNHLTVLHAIEVLWRENLQFSVTFVGGNSWGAERFVRRLEDLRRAGRPVVSVKGMPDDDLWAAYRAASVVLFPSLNEGFGLPVAEALASGTPVVTSGFGSMAELAGQGGAVTVDPRDDASVTAGLRLLLGDGEAHARAAAAAATRPVRTWDDYADDLWEHLVAGTR